MGMSIQEPGETGPEDRYHDCVFIVDDDPRVLNGLHATLSLAGLQTLGFESAERFLDHVTVEHSGCLLVDIKLPGMNGLDLQHELARLNPLISVIVITGHADVQSAVRAMKAGALEIMQKPFRGEQLLAHIHRALAISRTKTRLASQEKAERRRLEVVTQRERQVLNLILDGLTNREIARDLGISSRTVEVHRARLMKKLEVEDVVGLVRLAGRMLQ
jgi:two-component system, LuxR family, response regulator FixJ